MNRPTYEELEQKIRILEQQQQKTGVENTSLFQVLAEYSPSPIVLIRKHRYLFVNSAWEKLTGYSLKEALTFNSLDLVHPDMRDTVKKRREARIRGEHVPERYEMKIIGKSGSTVWLDASIALVNYQGAPAILTVSNDITERRRMEKDLRERKLRYKALFEDSPISLWEEDFSRIKTFFDELTEQGIISIRHFFDENPHAVRKCLSWIRVVDVNKATLKLYEADDKNLLMGKLSSVLPSITEPIMKEKLISMYENGTYETEIINHTVTGRRLQVLIHLSVPPGYEETWEKVFISVQDLTERHETEREKKRLEAQLQKARKMEAIGTLAGGIAHEFNNIVSIILGNAELAAEELPETSFEHENMKEIQTACLRAKNVIRQLLNCCPDASNTANAAPVDLGIILNEYIKLIQSTLPAGIHVESFIQPGAYTISADIDKVNELLLNLTNNAVQSMNGCGSLAFNLDHQRIDQNNPLRPPELPLGWYVHLTVKDTGHGIPPHLMERIFDPYFTTREVGEGTGMGLSTVQGILKEYQGGISVKSPPGQGTTFHIFFPVIAPVPSDNDNSDEIICGNGEKIMLVDDETSLLKMGVQRLARLNYRVTAFEDAAEAVRRFKADPYYFDLVITDMTMPDFNGDELARQVLAVRKDLPVIIYTGYNENINEKSALELGISGYLEKPIEYKCFARSVHEALNRK